MRESRATMNVVIVGNGTAGNTAAFYLKQRDGTCNITIVSAEPHPEYDPCSLPYYLGGRVPRESVFKRAVNDYAEQGIRLMLDNPVMSINGKKRFIETRDGKKIPFDKLILAYGGISSRPKIEGLNLEGIHFCKQLSCADRLFNRRKQHYVVVGSGAVGVGTAEALRNGGADVTLIEWLDRLLPTLLDPPLSRLVELVMTQAGIQIFSGEKVSRIEGDTGVERVITNRRSIDCDAVVIASGVAPDIRLARAAGITVGRGIRVNEKMETSLEGVYACGDCAETRDAWSGHWSMYQLKHNAIDQAICAARNILGDGVSYPGSYAFAKIHLFDTSVTCCGPIESGLSDRTDLEIIDRRIDNSHLRVLIRQGRIIGAQAANEFCDFFGLLLAAIWRGDDINQLRLKWPAVACADSAFPWTFQKLGQLIGLSEKRLL